MFTSTPMEGYNPSLPILRLTDRVATYMNRKFMAIINKEERHVPFPNEWSIQLLIDCDLATNVIFEAFQNRSIIIILLVGIH